MSKEEHRVYYYENGEKMYEEWFRNGQLHREGNKPAYIKYYENGKKEYETWWKNGQRHREGDKPAWIEYEKEG